MKVFVVTSGYYSDYTIEKLFSNRPAAEEYRKWHGIHNEVEEFDVYDEPFTTEDGERAMLIRVQGTVYPEAVVNIRFETRHTMIHSYTTTCGAGISRRGRGPDNSFDLHVYRCVPIDLWDEEQWKAKMTKTLYDQVAVAKSMFAEGASVTMVEKALMNTSKESM